MLIEQIIINLDQRNLFNVSKPLKPMTHMLED